MNHSWIRLFGLRTSRILFLEDILPWTLGKESLLIMKMTRSFSICDREQISQSSSITATFSFWTQTSSPFQRSSKMCQAPWEVIIGILLWLSDLSWTIQTTPATKVDFDLLAAHNHPTTGPSSNFEGCVKYKLSFEVGWDLLHPSLAWYEHIGGVQAALGYHPVESQWDLQYNPTVQVDHATFKVWI